MASQRKQGPVEKVSIRITEWMGTPQSLIAHSIFFIGVFCLGFFGFAFDQILLILTTGVSLEAIYLSLFIQMTVNRNTESLEDVEENIDDIQEDVEDLEENFGEISEDVEGLQGNIDKIQDNFVDLEENIDGISEDVDRFEKLPLHTHHQESIKTINNIEQQLTAITSSLNTLRKEIELLKDQDESEKSSSKLPPSIQ